MRDYPETKKSLGADAAEGVTARSASASDAAPHVAPHTPLLWMVSATGPNMRDGYSQPFGIAEYGCANLIAGVFGDVRGGEATAKANAEFIVRACNSHEELLAALKQMGETQNLPIFAIRAIAKAEGR